VQSDWFNRLIKKLLFEAFTRETYTGKILSSVLSKLKLYYVVKNEFDYIER